MNPPPPTTIEADRQLPAGDEIFLDHVAHFVRDADAARDALTRCGFAPTPVSIQVNTESCGAVHPSGTGNITMMFERGYAEVLFKTSDTPLAREFDAMLDGHAGVHLAAFSVADADAARGRLAADGFAVRDLIHMARPVATATGPDTAAFSIARVEPGDMPEGRIQMLTHHTEPAVWQKRWLDHPNSAIGLIDLVIAVADLDEAARRFERFTGRAATGTSGGAVLHLDRGGLYLVNYDRITDRLPEVAITKLPFMAGYAVRVRSLAVAETTVDRADLAWHAFEGGIAAAFPSALGQGAWFFVEDAAGLPWRR